MTQRYVLNGYRMPVDTTPTVLQPPMAATLEFFGSDDLELRLTSGPFGDPDLTVTGGILHGAYLDGVPFLAEGLYLADFEAFAPGTAAETTAMLVVPLDYMEIVLGEYLDLPLHLFDLIGTLFPQGEATSAEDAQALLFGPTGPSPYDVDMSFRVADIPEVTAIDIAETRGTEAAELMAGTDGVDILLGLGGDDGLQGGAGNDMIDGGDGHDILAAGAGNDILRGGAGDDSFGGGEGQDSIEGEAGNDVIGAGLGDDHADGGAGDDIVNGGAGSDTLMGGSGSDTMGASFGNDLVLGSNYDAEVAGIEDSGDSIGGGAGRDYIEGAGGNDTVGGGEGDDTIFGQEGDDFLAGGGRDDLVEGGVGNDTINAGSGDDAMSGGDGADVFVFNLFRTGESDVIADFEDGVDRLRLVGVENAPGTGLPGKLAALEITDYALGARIVYAGHEVLLEGMAAADLGPEDLIFV